MTAKRKKKRSWIGPNLTLFLASCWKQSILMSSNNKQESIATTKTKVLETILMVCQP